MSIAIVILLAITVTLVYAIIYMSGDIKDLKKKNELLQYDKNVLEKKLNAWKTHDVFGTSLRPIKFKKEN